MLLVKQLPRQINILIFVIFIMSFIPGNAQRMQTPDGESVRRIQVIGVSGSQIRIVSTPNSLYISKYFSPGGWSQNILLYMAPPSRTISDFNFKFGESGNERTFYLMLDNGTLYTFTFDAVALTFKGNPIIKSPPTVSGQGTFVKIIGYNSLYIRFSSRIYVDRMDGNGWSIDSAGLRGAQVNEIIFDKDGNRLAATNRGLFRQSDTSFVWQRVTSLDSANYSAIFLQRNGTIWIGSQNKGVFTSLDNTSSWTRDTTMQLSTIISRFGDDASGNMYIISTAQSSVSSLYRKLSDGLQWERIDSLLSDYLKVPIRTYRIYDISGEATLEIATGYGNYTSGDFGLSWASSYTGILSEEIYSLQFLQGDRIATSTSFGIFIKRNAAAQWQKTFPETGFNGGLVLRRDASNNLYFQIPSGQGQTHQPDIYKSTDGGDTWLLDTAGLSNVPVASGFTSSIFYVDYFGGQHFGFSSGNNQSLRVFSKDIQSTFIVDTLGTNLPPQAQRRFDLFSAFGCDGKDNLYFSGFSYQNNQFTNSYLYKRNHNDSLWIADTSGLGLSSIISFSYDKGGKMYVGSLASGYLSKLFKYNNNRWDSLNVPPAAVSDLRSIAFDSTGALYANFGPYYSGSNMGVYLTTDDGSTWQYAGLDSINVRGLSPNGNLMYGYTNRGAYKLTAAPLKLPKLVLSLNNIDFGKVEKDNFKDTTLKVSNEGNEVLRVSNITSTNGAFAAQQRVFEVEPGKSQDVIIRFTPTANGIVSATMRISSNTYPVNITVSGEGLGFKNPIMVLSSDTVDFGKVEGGKSKDTTVIIRNIGNDSLKISGITSTNIAFTVNPTQLDVLPGDSAELSLKFIPQQDGVVNATIRISGNIQTRSIVVKGEGFSVAPPGYTLSTKSIDFGEIELGTMVDTLVTIYNTGGTTIRVSQVRPPMQFFSITYTPKEDIEPGMTNYFGIRFTPLKTDTVTGWVIIMSNAPTDSVFVTGSGKMPGGVDESSIIDKIILDVYPNPIENFGEVKVNIPNEIFAYPGILNSLSQASLSLFDLLGNFITTLEHGNLVSGENIINLDLNNKPLVDIRDGVFILRLNIGNLDKYTIFVFRR